MLVAIVVLVFLQSWRSALIPLVAVPVAIIGTFAVMAAIGFSLNNLTLFGSGAGDRHRGRRRDRGRRGGRASYRGGNGARATRRIQAMREVSGPVIAVALVLTAVFMPCTFISGITGSFFKQFAVTVSVSTVISAFNSLTLSPALAAILLKPDQCQDGHPWPALLDLTLGWFFRLFNWSFRQATNGYLRVVGMMLRGSAIVLVLYGGLLFLTHGGFTHLPTGYLPEQDKGYLADLRAIARRGGRRAHRRRSSSRSTDRRDHRESAVAHTLTLAGQSFTLGVIAPNAGQFFVILKDVDERRDPRLYYKAIKERLTKADRRASAGSVTLMFGPPPLQGLGQRQRIPDDGRRPRRLGTRGAGEGSHASRRCRATASARHGCGRGGGADKAKAAAGKPAESPAEATKPPGDDGQLPPTPEEQRLIDIAHQKLKKVFTSSTSTIRNCSPTSIAISVRSMGLNLNDVNSTLQTYLGSLYVNDFNRFGRTWQVRRAGRRQIPQQGRKTCGG